MLPRETTRSSLCSRLGCAVKRTVRRCQVSGGALTRAFHTLLEEAPDDFVAQVTPCRLRQIALFKAVPLARASIGALELRGSGGSFALRRDRRTKFAPAAPRI